VSKLPLPRPVPPVLRRSEMPKRPAVHRLAAKVGYRGRSVGTLLPKITQKVFEKFGFSTATLLTDWAIIVGRDLAVYTAPERLKWPRGYESAPDAGENVSGRPGATLMLRVEPARALDIQYKSRLLVDRINAYFGYRAVAEIRLIQAPLIRTDQPRFERPPSSAIVPAAMVLAIEDEGLRTALIALEASIKTETAARGKLIPADPTARINGS
jgi:hypothetical protein